MTSVLIELVRCMKQWKKLSYFDDTEGTGDVTGA